MFFNAEERKGIHRGTQSLSSYDQLLIEFFGLFLPETSVYYTLHSNLVHLIFLIFFVAPIVHSFYDLIVLLRNDYATSFVKIRTSSTAPRLGDSKLIIDKILQYIV